MQNLDFNGLDLSGSVVALAVSGGRDSMAMLDMFLKEASAVKDFFVVNVEHGIRGESSKRDSRFVEEYCKKRGIRFLGLSLDVPALKKESGLTLEEAAREARYREFFKLLDGGEADFVLTAHNRDDLAETVLMRILRGTGVRGLSGISSRGRILRPMLKITRAEIDRYVQENGVPFVEDETNSDSAYARNFIRHQALPLLKTRWPEASENLARLAENAAEATAFIEKCAPAFTLKDGAAVFDAADLSEPAPAKAAFQSAARALGAVKDIERTHLEALYKLSRAENGKSLDLPYGLSAHKEYRHLVINKAEESQKTEIAAPKTAEGWQALFLPSSLGMVSFEVKECSSGEAAPILGGEKLVIDFAKIPEGAVLRNRREGDYFHKFGGGKVSLSDYLIDKKIPKRLRDRLILLGMGSEVLFIAGVEISDKVKTEGDTRAVLVVKTGEKP
jgi:tRNA(Ile)-lysidine synthase